MLDSSINQNINLFSKFSSKNLNSNKSYLSEVYGKKGLYSSNKTVMYYNDESVEQDKKKSHKKAVLISVASVLSLISVAGFMLFRNRGVNLNSIKNGTSKVTGKIQDMPALNKGANFMVNQQIKDDIWDRIATKLYNDTPFKFVKNWGDKMTGVYKKIVKNSTSKSFQDSVKTIKELAKKEGIEIKNLQDNFDDVFYGVDSNVNKLLKENRISSGLFNGNRKSKIHNFVDNMTSDVLADKKIVDVYNDFLIKAPEGASKELKAAIDKYNSLFGGTIIPKLRDINCGAAPMDVISVLMPALALGLGAANADNKEERRTILLDIGIPLIGTASMPIIGTFVPVLNGIKLWIAGLAGSEVLKRCAKGIIKLVENKTGKTEDSTVKA